MRFLLACLPAYTILLFSLPRQDAVAAGDSKPPAQPRQESPRESSTQAIQRLLLETEPWMGRPSPETLSKWTLALEQRGLRQAAKEVAAAIPKIENAQLVRGLLAIGQPSAALAVIEIWQRDEPENADACLLEAVAQMSLGSPEIAQRALARARGRLTTNDEALARTMENLLAYQASTGRIPGIDGNPWGVQFIDETGHFVAGRIAQAQKDKIPVDAAASIARLLAISPRIASLWALLGEFANADGDVAVAEQCFQRAVRNLQYAPRVLLDHLRVVEAYRKSQENLLSASLGRQADSNPPRKPADEGWSTLSNRPRFFAVVAIGGTAILVVLILQLRVWMARRRGTQNGLRVRKEND